MSVKFHVPVLVQKVIEYLKINPDGVYIDATVGTGGHAEKIVEKLKNGKLIGIDCDIDAVKITKKKFGNDKRVEILYGNFADLRNILKGLEIEFIDGILFDLGISTLQVSTPERGFSFNLKSKLDMRMDRTQNLTAYQVVNNYSYRELERIFKEYGEEKWSKKIALKIKKYRETTHKNIEYTTELAEIVKSAIPLRFQSRRIHSATRIFQALRIEVNNELENLKKALNTSIKLLKPNGKILVISYHSLEDRIVKQFFNQNKLVDGMKLNILTKKPVVPDRTEIEKNPKARSAKLRVAELFAARKQPEGN